MSKAYTLKRGKVEPAYGVNKERVPRKRSDECDACNRRKVGNSASF